MTKRKKILLWVGLVLSLPSIYFSGTSFVFYAWQNAANPDKWPVEKAAPLAYSSLAIAVLFFLLFVYCLVVLIKNTNKDYRESQ